MSVEVGDIGRVAADGSASDRGRGGRSRFPRRLLLVVLSTLLTLLVLELLLALAGVNVPAPALYPGDITPVEGGSVDPLLGWKLPPDGVVLDQTVDYEVNVHSNA